MLFLISPVIDDLRHKCMAVVFSRARELVREVQADSISASVIKWYSVNSFLPVITRIP